MTISNPAWPDLPFEEWKDTCATLHMWTQVVGKIRLAQTPWTNHSWHVPLYVTARGMTTSPIPYGVRSFEIDFDFIDHCLRIQTSDAMTRTMALRPRSVADFYEVLFAHLADLGFDIKIHAAPNEVVGAIPFRQDDVHASYDAEYANRFWRVLVQADRVFKQFRAGFIGKSSPVHFYCPDWVMRDAYSHEVSSCGFWPGSEAMPAPAFYSYAYPEPPGFSTATARPDAAHYNSALGEFILPYAVVRQSQSPNVVLLEFLTSTYEAAADLGKWDRTALELKGAPVNARDTA